MEEEIWNLIARKLAGEASPEELLELEKALRLDPDLYYSLEAMHDMWVSNPVPENELAEKAFDKHMERMRALAVDQEMPGIEPSTEELPDSRRRISKTRLFTISALSLILIAFGVFLFGFHHANPEAAPASKTTCIVITRNGSKTNLFLPDGTAVWLNAGSRLTYDSLFGINAREVTLSGEGFFDVVRNPAKPFIIHTGDIDIRVLGTIFNVKSYPGEKTIETSLIRGSIEIDLSFPNSFSRKIVLRPNQKMVIKKKEVMEKKDARHPGSYPNLPFITINKLKRSGSDSTIAETAWIQNRLTFMDMSLKELVTEMERKYGVPISLQGPGLDTLHFTGSFQNETVLQALDALRLTAEESTVDFSYRMEGNKVVIYNLSNGHSTQPK
jgi:ferric-dicitrate binding protein FerR (iron transport regulator)